MKSVFTFSALVALSFPFSAHALSCAWPSVEEALEQYPVTVLGKVTDTRYEELEEGAKHMLLQGYQHVTLSVEEWRAPEDMPKPDGELTFREAVTMYDSSFFRKGTRYVVFLRQQEDGTLSYPVCGFHLNADDTALDMGQVKADIGWK